MKHYFILITILFLNFSIYGQEIIEQTFYKDKYKQKISSVEKAKYSFTEYQLDDGVTKTEFRNLKSNIVLTVEKFNKDGEPTGNWFYIDHKGNKKEVNYDQFTYEDISDFEYYFELGSSDSISFVLAEFIDTEFYKFLAMNIRYPKYAVRNGVQGKIWLNIKIDIDGSVEVISFKEKLNVHLEAEAKRVLEKMKFNKPSMQDDKQIVSYTTIPINFTLR